MTRLLDSVSNRDEWLTLWGECGHEPFAHPAYGELFAKPNDHVAALWLVQTGGFALVPLLIRPVPDSLSAGRSRYDVISPYGYGGPYVSGQVDPERLLRECSRWLAQSGYCSAFLRLSLGVDLPAGDRTSSTRIVDSALNIVVDLGRNEEQIWSGYEHKVRKNVKKALRAGCSVHRDDDFGRIDDFLDVYSSTMRRRGAESWYHFDKLFFERLAVTLRGSYSVFSVVDRDGRVVSVECVLESDQFLYSFLGGTLSEAFAVSPNDLLKHEVILHGLRTGRRGYVLGGGYQPDDGIFRYKRGFAPAADCVQVFRTARLVGDVKLYEVLVSNRRLGSDVADVAEAFFPLYRRPVEK